MHHIRRLGVLVTILLLMSGCSVYNTRYAFSPHPASVSLGTSGNAARTLVSVVGVRRHDSQTNLPASVELRLRVENRSSTDSVEFDPASLRMLDARLNQFPRPIVDPPDPVVLQPGVSAPFVAYFPFPGGSSTSFDLSSLSLDWELKTTGAPVAQSTTFTRRAYYGPRRSVYVSYGHYGHYGHFGHSRHYPRHHGHLWFHHGYSHYCD